MLITFITTLCFSNIVQSQEKNIVCSKRTVGSEVLLDVGVATRRGRGQHSDAEGCERVRGRLRALNVRLGCRLRLRLRGESDAVLLAGRVVHECSACALAHAAERTHVEEASSTGTCAVRDLKQLHGR